MREVSMAGIRREHKGFFFSPATTRFFKSRYPRTAYRVGNVAYFVTSEQREDYTPRLYTLRVYGYDTHEIDTVGEFQQYLTRDEAMQALKLILAQIPQKVEDVRG